MNFEQTSAFSGFLSANSKLVLHVFKEEKALETSLFKDFLLNSVTLANPIFPFFITLSAIEYFSLEKGIEEYAEIYENLLS